MENSHSRDVLEHEHFGSHKIDELNVPLKESISRISRVALAREREALARRASGNQVDSASETAQLPLMRTDQVVDRVSADLQPGRPIEGMARIFGKKIRLEGIECLPGALYGKQTFPTGHAQPERETSAAREQVDESWRSRRHKPLIPVSIFRCSEESAAFRLPTVTNEHSQIVRTRQPS
jgi:hypothetical protein